MGGPLDDATVTKQKVGDGYYALHFSIFYETRVGQTLAVVGSLKELGQWKDYNCHLIWTDGHIWRSGRPIIVRESYFEYKYVLLDNDEVVGWEEGVNRIADLDALPEITRFDDDQENAKPNMAKDNITLNKERQIIPPEYRNKKVKHCQFKDIWESYTIKFSLYDPLYQQGDEMFLQCSLYGMEQIRMERTQ